VPRNSGPATGARDFVEHSSLGLIARCAMCGGHLRRLAHLSALLHGHDSVWMAVTVFTSPSVHYMPLI
jgi:hypothetical protein